MEFKMAFSTFEDKTGNRYGMLSVLSHNIASSKKHGKPYWDCQCDCGKLKTIASCSLRLDKPRTVSCGCKPTPAKNPTMPEAPLRAKYRMYTKSITQKNKKRPDLKFELAYEQCLRFFKSNCFYCGVEPCGIAKSIGTVSEMKYNGIDRKDSSIGYLIDNCVPCCTECNYGKGVMEFDEFIEWIGDVYHNRLVISSSFDVSNVKLVSNVTGKDRTSLPYWKVYKTYQKGVKRKAIAGLCFDMNYDQFAMIYQSKCFYCDSPPEKHKSNTIEYNGVDRLDSSIGYTTENCVPCCHKCNWSKNDRPIEKFLCWIERIFNFQKMV